MPAGSILVADDDTAIRTVLNQALSRAGYEVRLTGNAATLWHSRPVTDYRDVNRANWDERVPAHVASAFYGVPRFLAEPDYLSDVVQFDRPLLGDIAGLRGVHLQCHIGTDTLSLARLGASVKTNQNPGMDVLDGSFTTAAGGGLLAKVSTANVPNLANVSSTLLTPVDYASVPYRGSAVVLAYNAKYVSTPPKTGRCETSVTSSPSRAAASAAATPAGVPPTTSTPARGAASTATHRLDTQKNSAAMRAAATRAIILSYKRRRPGKRSRGALTLGRTARVGYGEMAEWSNAPPWKGGTLARVSRVRIPLSPR